jgi:cytoskeletal protein CcmA (bactofilin family)
MRRIFGVTALVLGLALPVAAFAVANEPQANVTLAHGDNRAGTYYAAAQTVTVDGDVAGDVVCAGQTVVINGAVGGDVLCAAQTITINGAVGGNVRSAAQTITVHTSVARNVTVAAQTLVLDSASKVGGDLAVGAQSVTVDGPVAHDMYVGANSLQIGAEVAGNVTAQVQSLDIGNQGRVNGGVNYTSSNTLTIDAAKVHGGVTRHSLPAPKPEQIWLARLAMMVYWLVAMLVIALGAIWLLPRMVQSVSATMLGRREASLGWGALALVATPLVLLLLAVSVVGVPLAIIVGTLWGFVLMSSAVWAGVAFGTVVLRQEGKTRGELMLAALAGIPLVMILSWVPILGVVVRIAAAAWSLGGIMLTLNSAKKL